MWHVLAQQRKPALYTPLSVLNLATLLHRALIGCLVIPVKFSVADFVLCMCIAASAILRAWQSKPKSWEKRQNFMSRFQHSLECFIRGLGSINTPDYFETHLYWRPTGRPSFTARLVGCSLRASWAGVANSQTDRHRAKVTVGAYMWACELPVVVLA